MCFKYRIPAINEHLNDVLSQQVSILVQKAFYFVDNFASVMLDNELGRWHSRLIVQRIRAVNEMTLVQKWQVRCLL